MHRGLSGGVPAAHHGDGTALEPKNLREGGRVEDTAAHELLDAGSLEPAVRDSHREYDAPGSQERPVPEHELERAVLFPFER